MKITVVFLTIILMALGKSIPAVDRIIGGKKTTIEQYPYQVSLRYGGSHYCGGAILNKNTIITAAHCIVGLEYSMITVMVGHTINYKGKDLKLSKIIPHPEYNKGINYNKDIGILKLVTPLTFSNKIQPIPLQSAKSQIPEGISASVSGWGTTNADYLIAPDALHVAYVSVITNKKCLKMYGWGISSQMLCALTPGKDSCQGDSGGPLAANGKLIGIISWGVGCAEPEYPGVYANVSALHDFIKKYL